MPIRTLVFVLALGLLAAGAFAETPAPGPPSIDGLAGEWSGTNKLWFKRKTPRESPATAAVSAQTVSYTWAYEGKPQTGTFTLAGTPEATTATWTDTWHAKKPMELTGTTRDGAVRISTTYAGNWGWRIDLAAEGDSLVLRMTNITPKGKELPALELRATRLAPAGSSAP